MKTLSVFFQEYEAGRLIEEDDGSFAFTYLSSYLKLPNARPISVNLPLREEPFRSAVLFPFFDNLLAEGWLLDIQTHVSKINPKDRFGLIARFGLECVGAVSLRGMDER